MHQLPMNKKLSYRSETARHAAHVYPHVYLGWLTDRAMHRTPHNRRGYYFWHSRITFYQDSITATRTACYQPSSRRISVTILLRLLCSSCTMISFVRSTEVSSFLSSCSTWVRPLTRSTTTAYYQSSSAGSHFSVDGDAMTWFDPILPDRQITDVRRWRRHTRSIISPVNCSVPQQGSVLGPIKFITYTLYYCGRTIGINSLYNYGQYQL